MTAFQSSAFQPSAFQIVLQKAGRLKKRLINDDEEVIMTFIRAFMSLKLTKQEVSHV